LKDLIVKDNKLIRAKYSLSLYQTRFIAHMATRINRDDTDFFTYTIRLNELLELLNIERRHWKRLDKTLTELIGKIIVIENSDIEIKKTALLSYFSIDKKTEIVEYRFDKSMKPYLLDLGNKFKKGSYTKLSFEKIVGFSSQYSAKLYEILEMKAKQSEAYRNSAMLVFEYDLQDLKELLLGQYNLKTGNIEIPKSYNIFGNFKKRVLDPAHRELKEKGEYFFEYQTLKVGNRVVGIQFTIHKNGEKIKKEAREKRRQFLLKGEEKQLVAEQIKRMIARQGDKIRDKLKYEQKMMQLYFQGKLKYDKDLQEIKDELDKKALGNILNYRK
jgi:plasmid replication initiation protein